MNGIAGFTGVVGFGFIAYLSYYILNEYNLFLMRKPDAGPSQPFVSVPE